MCGDDLEAQLHEVDPVAAEANARKDFVTDPKTRKNFHPGVTLGVSQFFGTVSAYRGFWIMRKSGNQYRPVVMSGKCLIPHHWPESYRELAEERILEDGLVEIVDP